MTVTDPSDLSWHILDPAMGYPEAIGHHLSYNAALSEGLRRRQQPCFFYGHRHGQAVARMEGSPLKGVFHYCHLERMSRFGSWGIRFRILVYFLDLLRLPLSRPRATSIFFFHTVILDQLAAILLWQIVRPAKPGDRVVVLLRYDLPKSDDFSLRLSKWLLRKFRFAALQLASDSAGLARHYNHEFGRSVSILPIPHAPAPRPRPYDRPLTIGYLGTSFCERGYHMLPDLIAGILHRAPDVRLIIQSQPQMGRLRELEAFDRICFLEEEYSFRHMRGSISGVEMQELLGELDLILLPYNPRTYRDRTAGVFSDAVSANVVPIVTRGTWMAEQLASLPESFQLAPEYSSRAFIDAAMRFRAEASSFRQAYREYAVTWRNRNTVDALLDVISISSPISMP